MKNIIFFLFLFIFMNSYSQMIKKIEPDEGKIISLSFSNNGDYLLAGTSTRIFFKSSILCYSSFDWKKIWQKGKGEGWGGVHSIKFSKDDKFIAITKSLDKVGFKGLSISLLDLNGDVKFNTNFKNTNTYEHNDFNIDFSNDNNYLILNRKEVKVIYESKSRNWYADLFVDFIDFSSGETKNIGIKNYSYKQKVINSKDKNIYETKYDKIAISKDGKYILLTGYDNEILCWDVESKKCHTLLSKNELLYSTIAISPDGSKAAIANYSNENWIYIWDLNSKLFTKIFKGHEDYVKSLAFSFDGNYLVSASEDETIRIWDVKTEKTIKTLSGHTSDVNALALSPDGRYLASGSDDGTIIIWDAGEIIPNIKLFTANYDLSFGLEEKLMKEKKIEIEALSDYFRPKGEFETTIEYNERVEKGNNEIKLIEEKFAMKYEELKKSTENQVTELTIQKEDFEKNKEIEKQNTINNSIKDTVVLIASVGTYNADEQTLPIQVKGNTGLIIISVSDAQSLKKNWKSTQAKCKKRLSESLKSYEYYDVIVIHPITKAEYILNTNKNNIKNK